MQADQRLKQMLQSEKNATAAAERAEAAAASFGGGGTPGGFTDDWKTSVDERLKTLRDDVVQVRNWVIACVAAPFIALIAFYVAIGGKFDQAETRTVGVENKLSTMLVEQAKTNGDLKVLIERSSPKQNKD